MMKDWPDRETRTQFGQWIQTHWEAQIASRSAVKEVLLRLALDLATTMAKYGYRPDMKTLRLMQDDGPAWNYTTTYGVKLYADFMADPVTWLYELDAEMQKLRDLLASLVETKDAVHS